MEITRTSVPGVGMMHHCVTRGGQHFRVLENKSGSRTLYMYGPSDAHDEAAPDEQFVTIELDEDEADYLANMLHSRPIPDRVADLERRFTEIAGEDI